MGYFGVGLFVGGYNAGFLWVTLAFFGCRIGCQDFGFTTSCITGLAYALFGTITFFNGVYAGEFVATRVGGLFLGQL